MSDDHTTGSGPDETALARIETEVAMLMRLGEATRRATGTAEHRVLDRAAYVILRHLAVAGPQNVSALAARLNLDGSTVTRQVSAMQRDALIARAPDPTDGRGTVISPPRRGCTGWPPCGRPAPGSTATSSPTGRPGTETPSPTCSPGSTRPWRTAPAAEPAGRGHTEGPRPLAADHQDRDDDLGPLRAAQATGSGAASAPRAAPGVTRGSPSSAK